MSLVLLQPQLNNSTSCPFTIHFGIVAQNLLWYVKLITKDKRNLLTVRISLSFYLDLILILFPNIQDLAKELLDLFTANKMAKAFFTNSGSEANDTQVVTELAC